MHVLHRIAHARGAPATEIIAWRTSRCSIPFVRADNIKRVCFATTQYMGWHLSYAMSSARIVQKLKIFSHSDQPHVLELARRPDATEHVARCAQKCKHLFKPNDKGNALLHYESAPYDGKLPPLPGWPHNEAAPAA